MADDQTIQEPTDWGAIATQMLAALLTQLPDVTVHKAIVNAHADARATWVAVLYEAALSFAAKSGSTMHQLEEPFFPFIAAFTAPVVSGLFGAEVNEATFARRLAHGGGAEAGKSIVSNFIAAITGPNSDAIQPGDEGARRIAGAAVTAALESTFNAVATEMLSDLVPEIGPHFESLTELPEAILRTLGVGRLVRRALTPYVNVTCATPALWAVNKQHRPTMLGASTLAKRIARNPDEKERWLEDLRREGYSEDRIAALLDEQRRFFSASEVRTFVTREWWSNDQGLQHLRDQGYDEDGATDALRLEGLRRIDQLETQQANAIIDAYVSGDIDHGAFVSLLGSAVTPASERALLTLLAETRRAVNVKHLSLSQVESMVKSGVLSVIDYRQTAERVGYTDDAVIALELQLRYELDKAKSVEQHRVELDAERAAEKTQRAADALARKAATDAKLALQRRGRIADLEAAYVRGLVPLDRVQQLYAATYDADVVGVLSNLVQTRRADYVAQLAAAEAARKRAASRGVNVGELETAAMTGVLTPDRFRSRLDQLGFSPEDADLLSATLAARIAQRDDAQAKHDAAAAAAKVRHVDLATFELLVRRGHRTMGDYAALLRSLNFDDAAIAALTDRLQILIDDDAAAAQTRAAAAAKLRNKGLSLDQERRAVILGVRPIAQFASYLLANGFGADAVATLNAELQIDVDEAEAARRRRADAERRSQAGSVPLSDVRRAARLGLIPVAAYYARLAAAGYSDDDIALESDLLAAEIGDAAARSAAATATETASAPSGLTLAQLAAAVKAGAATIDQYHARALAVGLSPADANILTATLQDAIDVAAVARQRARELADAGGDRELSRSDLEKAVRKGTITIDDYAARLPTLGYTADDAALLVAVLRAQLGDGTTTGAAGG